MGYDDPIESGEVLSNVDVDEASLPQKPGHFAGLVGADLDEQAAGGPQGHGRVPNNAGMALESRPAGDERHLGLEAQLRPERADLVRAKVGRIGDDEIEPSAGDPIESV